MSETKTILSIKAPSPQWATILFRVVLLLATTFNTAIYGAPNVNKDLKLALMYWSGILVTFIWGLSKILGLKVQDETLRAFTRPSTDPKEPPPGPKP